MFSRLPTASLRLSELLAAPFEFCIPPYQRQYAWDVENAAQLVEDICDAGGIPDETTAESDYFLGAILLLENGAPATPAAGTRKFEIVDGQQRLTTLTIFAAGLRDMDPETEHATQLDKMIRSTSQAHSDDPASGMRLFLRSAEHDVMSRYVQQPGACHIAPVDTLVLSKSQKALIDVRDRIMQELQRLSAEQRTALAAYLSHDCHVVAMQTHDLDRAHRMFSIINDRGSPLKINDILKAEILRGIPAGERDGAVEKWDEAETELGDSFPEFFSHVRATHGYSGKGKIIAGVRNVVRDVGGPKAFMVSEFEPLSRAYRQIRDVSGTDAGFDDAVRRHLKRLARQKSGEWVPAALLVLRDYKSDPERASRVLAEIDCFINKLRLLCLGTGKRQRRFAHVVRSIMEGREGDNGAFALSREENRALAHNLKDLHQRNLFGCKLALLRINDELQPDAIGLLPGAVSVEHVLPQRPKGTSVWREWFPDPDVRQACTTSLGNLVLVSPKQNERARNLDFVKKQEIYRSPDSPYGVLEITREAVESDKWDRETIKRREAWVQAELARLWHIELPGSSGMPRLSEGEPDAKKVARRAGGSGS